MKRLDPKLSTWSGKLVPLAKAQPYMVLAIVLSVILVSASGYVVASGHPVPKPLPPKPVVVIKKPVPHPAPTYLQELPDPNAKPAPAPTTKPVVKSQPIYNGISACQQQLATAYNLYSATIQAELTTHQAKLAALQDDYNNGAYDDPDTGEPDDQAYQADRDSENNRYFSLIDSLYVTYKAQVAANGCPPIN